MASACYRLAGTFSLGCLGMPFARACCEFGVFGCATRLLSNFADVLVRRFLYCCCLRQQAQLERLQQNKRYSRGRKACQSA